MAADRLTLDEVVEFAESLGQVSTVRPGPGDGSPQIAWGNVFCYVSPVGQVAPEGAIPAGQPFATIVTKDYPGEPASGLGDGVFRVNIDAGRRGQAPPADPTVRDTVIAHPVYGQLGWVSIVEPGQGTVEEVRRLLTDAHAAALRRRERRSGAE